MAKKKVKKNLDVYALADKYEGSGVASDVKPDEEELLWVPTSSPVMNYLTGGGAMYGRIIEIAGQESSGKTLLALDLIKNAQEMGGAGIFIDAELAFSHTWAELNGIDLDKLYLFEENIIEVISDFAVESAFAYRSELTHNEPIVLVIDSVAALDTLVAMQTSEADTKAEMGNRAKTFYRMIRLRNRIWHKLGITVVFINQLRDKISTGFGAQFGDKVTTVGGNALKFFASQRIFLEAKKQITVGSKDKKRRVGIEVAVTMKKNKLAIPKVPTRVPVIFDPDYDDLGFDKYSKLSDILLGLGTIEKRGNSYYFGEESIAVGKEELEQVVEDDEDLREDLLYDANILTTSQMQERLDGISDNLFPVDGVEIVLGTMGNDDD